MEGRREEDAARWDRAEELATTESSTRSFIVLSARTPYESLLSVFCPFIKDLKRVISGFKFSDSLTDSFPYAFPQKVEKS